MREKMKQKKKIKEKESAHQKRIVSFCRKINVPIWASASGIYFSGISINIIMLLKSLGIIADRGEPDLFIPVVKRENGVIVSGGLFLEVKTDNGVPSEDQLIKINKYNNNGYVARIVYGSDEAIETILAYLGKA